MLTVNELFSGIGAFRKALINLNVPYKIVGISEIDKFAIRSYEAMYGKTRNYGDISKIEKLDYADLWTYGFPCQDISQAGKQAGIIKGKTRSGLLYEVERLLEESVARDESPKYLIMENVKALVGKKFINDFYAWIWRLNELGYYTWYKVINVADYGIPQKRERVIAVSIRKDLSHKPFKFPQKLELKKCMMNYLEEDVDEKYFLSDKMFAYVLDLDEKQKGTKWEGRANNDFINPRIAHTLSVRGIKSQRAGVSNIICVSDPSPVKVADYKKKLNGRRTNDHDLRNITERECFRLMGFSDSDYEKAHSVCSDTQLYKQAGNSIVVDVLEAVLKELLKDEI